ncbi:MAG: AAA family ATPase [Lachnospiraceae bacterium]|nr:AAA family ATPase [Lachnospiraceae bacterium]
MIKMTRLRLINWHNFQEDTIDFRNITYLLGVNAVGKTTIMDAIRYCLTTNKDFNTAGNKKSGRTLLGSVHQKQRAEDSYLRTGHTVSYIGVEFYDEANKKYFVIIVRVESESPKQDLKGVTQDWYITKPGYKLEDIPFLTTTKDGKKPTSRDAFKLENKGMDRASNQTDARKRICRVLGIGDSESPIGKKFNEVFHMGTSLEDIKDIREFIYTYILPEPEVNIEFLQKDMRELERLQEILQEAQDRENLLEQINEKINEAIDKFSKVKVNELLVTYAEYQGNVEEHQENRQLIEQYESSIEVLARKIAELSECEKEASDLLYQARKAAEDNEGNKELNSLQKENEARKKAYEKYCGEASVYEQLLSELKSLRKQLIKSGIVCGWDEGILQDDDVSEEEHLTEIRAARNALGEVRETIRDKDADYRTLIKELKAKTTELEKVIAGLSSGKMDYPEEALLVRDQINEMLIAENRSGDARLLCEWLYMNDDSWQDAVESYLNSQRFNIIVTPENYLLAKKIFISLGDKVKGTGLVDTRKLNSIFQKDEDIRYLCDTVESENTYAKRYVDFIMRGLVCCESADDLENYKKSVTRDRLRFQNYTLQRMAKQDHYIGVDAIEKRLEKTKTELSRLQQELASTSEKKQAFDSILFDFDKFVSGNKFELMEEFSESKGKAVGIQIDIEKTEKRIEELKKNPILCAMFDHVSECEKNHCQIRDEARNVEARKQNLEEKIGVLKKRNEELVGLSDSVKEEYEKQLAEYPQYSSEVTKKYADERKSKKAVDISRIFRSTVTQQTISLNNFMNTSLIPLQNKYTATYTCDFPEGIKGAAKYQQEYLSLKNIELERHKAELIQAQIRCKDRFRKEVLFRMKDDILRARQQFKQINRVMENLRYGEESYRFGIDRSKDKELGLFYDIIMDKDNQQIDQDNDIMMYLAEVNKSELFESQIEDFMSRIMVDVEEHAKENLTGNKTGAKSMGVYVDYRTYLDYDIIVKNSVTGMEVPLSKVSGEGSGGENQAPFYVAICASLLQIYEQNPDGCIKLVLLDEAFNNMTSDRIEPMMNMFKTLNLQLVLIATAEKATAILPFCDITYSIVKSGNRNAINVFERTGGNGLQ